MARFRSLAVVGGVILVSGIAARGEPKPVSLGLDVGHEGVDYDDARFDSQLYPVNIHNWWGHMDQRGRLVILPRFAWTDYSYDGLARVMVGGNTGFITGQGDPYIDPVLPWADHFQNHYAIASDGGGFGFLTRGRRWLVPPRLTAALRFREGYAAVQVGERIGFIDRRGKLVIPLRFSRARSFHEGLAMVALPGPGEEPAALGYINKRGDFVYRTRSDRLEALGSFHDGRARAGIAGRWGYLNRRFEVVIEPRFDEARHFSHGLAAVKKGERWGYINRLGRWIVPPVLEEAYDLKGGLAMVKRGGRWGYLNRAGKGGIRPQFEQALPFFHHYARVSQPPNFGYITVSGYIIWDPRVPLIAINDLTLAERINTWPLTELHPRIRLPPRREQAEVPYRPDYLYIDRLPKKMTP